MMLRICGLLVPLVLFGAQDTTARGRYGRRRKAQTSRADAENVAQPETSRLDASDLTEMLGDRDDMARLAAAAALVKVSPDEAKGAIQCIIELLRAEDAQVRYAALSALQSLAVRDGDIGWDPYTPHDPSSTFGNMGAEVIAAVTASLKDGDGRIREAAALALASIGPEAKDSAVVVEELFKDNEGRVRRAAAMAVGEMGPDVGRTIPALKALLKDRDGRVREAAAQSIEKIEPQASQGTDKLTRNRDVGRYVAIQVLERPDSDARAAVSAVARLLKADDWFLRVEAASFLGEIGPDAKATAPALLELLKDKDGQVRCSAALALGKVGTDAKQCVHLLSELLGDRDGEVRQAAAIAIGQIEGPEAKTAIPALTELLEDRDEEVRNAASEALGKINEFR